MKTQTQMLQTVQSYLRTMAESGIIARAEWMNELDAMLDAPRKRTSKPAEPINTNTATMSDSEVFAYYKRIGLREDVRFFLANTLDGPWILPAQALLVELEHRKSTAADRKRYNALTDMWRAAQLAVSHDDRRYARPQGKRERARRLRQMAA